VLPLMQEIICVLYWLTFEELLALNRAPGETRATDLISWATDSKLEATDSKLEATDSK